MAKDKIIVSCLLKPRISAKQINCQHDQIIQQGSALPTSKTTYFPRLVRATINPTSHSYLSETKLILSSLSWWNSLNRRPWWTSVLSSREFRQQMSTKPQKTNMDSLQSVSVKFITWESVLARLRAVATKVFLGTAPPRWGVTAALSSDSSLMDRLESNMRSQIIHSLRRKLIFNLSRPRPLQISLSQLVKWVQPISIKSLNGITMVKSFCRSKSTSISPSKL